MKLNIYHDSYAYMKQVFTVDTIIYVRCMHSFTVNFKTQYSRSNLLTVAGAIKHSVLYSGRSINNSASDLLLIALDAKKRRTASPLARKLFLQVFINAEQRDERSTARRIYRCALNYDPSSDQNINYALASETTREFAVSIPASQSDGSFSHPAELPGPSDTTGHF